MHDRAGPLLNRFSFNAAIGIYPFNLSLLFYDKAVIIRHCQLKLARYLLLVKLGY